MPKKITPLSLFLFLISCNACGDATLAKKYLDMQDKFQSKQFENQQFQAYNSDFQPKYKCKFNKKAKIDEGQKARVIKVSDGDTVHACLLPEGKDMIKIRTIGIDCPETSYNQKCLRDGRRGRLTCKEQIPLGKKATRVARGLMLDKNITLESHHGQGKFRHDRYKRTLAYIRLNDGKDYNKHTISEGLCAEYSYRFKHPRMNEYKKARPKDTPFK